MLILSRAPRCRAQYHVHLLLRRFANDADNVREHLRALLRDTAQPVAVVTALMDPAIPQSPPHAHPQHQHPSSPDSTSQNRFHGATLSSFSSIAMDPHPLVAFSLRIPSRMATSLTSAHSSSSSTSPPTTASVPTSPCTSPPQMVINILSERQATTAMRFSRADLYPTPFAGLPYTLSADGLPVLDGAVGALSCHLVAASWPLHDLESLRGEEGDKDGKVTWAGDGVASELFIAQVVRVERTLPEGEQPRPLLYYRRGYVTTCDLGPDAGAKPSH